MEIATEVLGGDNSSRDEIYRKLLMAAFKRVYDHVSDAARYVGRHRRGVLREVHVVGSLYVPVLPLVRTRGKPSLEELGHCILFQKMGPMQERVRWTMAPSATMAVLDLVVDSERLQSHALGSIRFAADSLRTYALCARMQSWNRTSRRDECKTTTT